MTCSVAGRAMTSSAPSEAYQNGSHQSQLSRQRSASMEITYVPDSVLTPEASQQNEDDGQYTEGTFTILNERKRLRDGKEDMDIDDAGLCKIRMKPDILSFFRTPGAFKFCRRVSSGPLIDHFHASNRGSPLPQNVVIDILSFLNKRDLCNAMATCRLLYMAGSRCRNWEQALSMEGQDMGDDALAICSAIGQNYSLTRLDLSMTVGITADGAQLICQGCPIIQHLNLSWSSLDSRAIAVFCSSLPYSVTRLNLAGSLDKSAMDDVAVEKLVTRCPNLKELDLSDNINITDKGLLLLMTLPQLESLSLNRCYGIPPMNFLMCGQLYFLNVFGCITDSGLVALKNGLVETEVNSTVFNYIAKPTVPPAVTSIWGQRTKDIY
ncbi:unnamed protein product [Nippostrongylus brasiliensis]|uniref:S-phase kinase-associated protein 2 (inferred by orthology to a human protein) n=1 Tax=Nippostrongylus brasiliensis TaxID=27835 RepID=A0A158R0P3_NIPBR|nr:unnamed protein product [Nippostrongylus brasiliensis]